jgi:hypothetical protein
MAAIVIAPTATSAAKTPAATTGTFRLRFGLVDGQRPSAQICAVKRRDSLVGFTGIGHFHETEPTGAASIPVGYECDLFNRTVCFEQISQLGFCCAVRQIPNVKVLYRNSSLSKSSKLVGVAVGFDGLSFGISWRAGSARIARVRAIARS